MSNDGQIAAQTPRPGWVRLWRPIALLAFVAAIIVLARVFGVGERIGVLREWIGGLGPWGPFAYIAIYIVATVAALPGSAITVVAGALFGSVVGVISVSVASTTGAGLAFLIARYFARGSITGVLAGNDKFMRLDKITADHGAIIVALTRLVPIFPFNLLNYGFGLTRVPFWTYLFWSWLCMLPGTVLFVVGADALTKGLAEGRFSTGLAVLVVAIGIGLTLLVRYARGVLREKESSGREADEMSEDKP
jgi:uncharacterized membrane protein YdjX (TVP38/TMEM64 family)